MRLTSLIAPLAAIALAAGAHQLAAEANQRRKAWPTAVEAPYAPSPGAAPFAALGYRETLADLLWIRALVYFGSDEGATAPGVRHLIEAIAELDPSFEPPLEWSALAMQSVSMTLTQDDYHAVLRVLEAAMVRFPDNFRFPQRAGEIYALRLVSDDPAQRRAWKVRGAQLLSRAVRMKGAPPGLGTYVAHLETELGQRDQAIADLRELILYTTDARSRDRLLTKLAKLSNTSTTSIGYELDVERTRFDEASQRDRPELPASMYVIAGPPIAPWFDPATLADDPAETVPPPIEPLLPLADDIGEQASPSEH